MRGRRVLSADARETAIDAFLGSLSELPILAVPSQVEEDVRALGDAFSEDHAFASALEALSAELGRIVADPSRSAPTQGHYAEWRRSKFQSSRSQAQPADLRIIFRRNVTFDPNGIELRAFGHRWRPTAIYLRAKGR